MGLSLFKFSQWAPKDASFLQQSAFFKKTFKVTQGRWFWYQSKARMNFLLGLVCHFDYGPILHCFWDTATYWLKIAYFSYPSLIRRPRSLCSLWNFATKLTVRKLVTSCPPVDWRLHECMFLAGVVLACIPACDRRSDSRREYQS